MKYLFIFLTIVSCSAKSQTKNIPDSISFKNKQPALQNKITYKNFVIPITLVGYGFAALGNNKLNEINLSTKEEIKEDNPNFVTHIDSYSQFFPAATVFCLHAFGKKGVHNTKDAAILYAMSMGISTAVIYPLKKVTHEERPDNSNFNSFPSGHTSTAFVSAEFLRREFGQKYPWLAVAGYAVATGTGMLRVYNNKHWVSDVVAGAGIGIASTTIAYWLYSKFNFKPNSGLTNIVAVPAIADKTYGFTLIKTLK